MQRILLFIAISLVLIALDLYSKSFFLEYFSSNSELYIMPLLTFTLAFNKGIAFSLPLTGLLQIIVSFAVLIGFITYIHVHWRWKPTLIMLASSLVTGGALGNLYERIKFQQVTDFIQVFDWFPIFNLADVFVFCGVALLLLAEWKNNPEKNAK